MPADSRKKALAEVKRAQQNFERDAEAVREARRRAFADALAAGLSLRDIAEEVGLTHSRVAQIVKGD